MALSACAAARCHALAGLLARPRVAIKEFSHIFLAEQLTEVEFNIDPLDDILRSGTIFVPGALRD